MACDDPVPAYFSWRYVLWLSWSNPVTILATLQGIFQAITLDDSLLPHSVTHGIAIANLVLIIIIAQIRKRLPPGPQPMKDPTP
jgi:hypothetical protein